MVPLYIEKFQDASSLLDNFVFVLSEAGSKTWALLNDISFQVDQWSIVITGFFLILYHYR